MNKLSARPTSQPMPFPIQGTGDQSRAFVYLEDFSDGLMLAIEKGEHLGIYHVGTTEEITIRELAHLVAECFGQQIELVPDHTLDGGPMRRCPDITKLSAFGYAPRYQMRQALPITIKWYRENAHKDPHASKRDTGQFSCIRS